MKTFKRNPKFKFSDGKFRRSDAVRFIFAQEITVIKIWQVINFRHITFISASSGGRRTGTAINQRQAQGNSRSTFNNIFKKFSSCKFHIKNNLFGFLRIYVSNKVIQKNIFTIIDIIKPKSPMTETPIAEIFETVQNSSFVGFFKMCQTLLHFSKKDFP